MFGKKSIDQITIEGDLEALKIKLTKSPALLNQEMSWSSKTHNFGGTLLHMAAFYNHPHLVEYLVTEKGMDLDALSSNNWTPLHHAAKNNAKAAAIKLVELGATPTMKTADGTLPAAQTTSPPLQDFLREKAEEYEAVRNRKQTAAQAAGEWTGLSDTEIMFERTLPGGHYRLTKVFNFAAAVCTSITKDLENGRIVQEEKKFEELLDQDIVKTACEKLLELRGVAAEITAPEEKPAAKSTQIKHSYDKLRDLGK